MKRLRERLGTFSALRHRDFRLLWIGLLTSNVGGSMQGFGLGWLVVQLAVRDGAPQLAPLYLGLVGISRGVPGVVFGLFGGVLADRFDRRALLMITRAGGSALAIVLAALTLSGLISIAAVMIVTVLSAIDNGFDAPARQAMAPRLVPERDLMSAVGLVNATINASQLFGPLIGGVLIGPIGVGGLMVVNAGAHLVAVAALVGMRPMPVPAAPRRVNVFGSLREGIVFVATEPVLRWVVAISTLTGLFGRPVVQLLPAVAHDTLGVGPTELSWLLTLTGVGSLAGSMAGASLGRVRRRGVLLLGSVIAWGALTVAFSLQTALVPALLLVGLPSVAWFLCTGVSFVFLQTRSPDRIRARAISVYQLSSQSVPSLGAFVLGTMGSALGINVAIGIGGVVLALAAATVLVRVPSVRRLGLDAAPAPLPARP